MVKVSPHAGGSRGSRCASSSPVRRRPPLPSLDAIAASGHDLVAVLTRPDAPAGRGPARRSPRRWPGGPTSAASRCSARPGPGSSPLWTDWPRSTSDCVPVVAYGALVPPVALAVPRYGWINLHFSLLPAWRGAAPVQHAVLHGDEMTGASVFAARGGPRHRPGLRHAGREDPPPRHRRATCSSGSPQAGAGLLVAVLDGIETGALKAEPQPADGVSLAPKITVADAEVRWAEPAFAVDRRIRACTPAPGAWTTLRGERVKLGPVLPVADGPRLAPGTVQSGENAGARRHGHRAGRARRGPPGRSQADGRRRLGAGSAAGRRRAVRSRV